MSNEVTIPEIKLPISVEDRVDRVNKAAGFASKTVAVIVDDKTDESIRLLIGKIKELGVSLENERMPYTRKMDEIKSAFIAQEKQVKDILLTLSKKRDAYVSFKSEKIRQEQIKQQFERFKSQELIEIEHSAAISLNLFVTSIIEKKKTAVLNALKSVNAENKAGKLEGLKGFVTFLDPIYLGTNEFDFKSNYGNDVQEIYANVYAKKEESLLEIFNKEIETFKHECILQFESLTNLTEADRKAVIAAKSDEVKVDFSTANEIAELEADQAATVAKAENSMLSIAEQIDNTLPSHSSGYEIEVLNSSGWLAIGAFWVTVFGPKFDGNFETKNFKSMKGDLEGLAKKEGTKLVSDNIVYHAKVKARN